MDRSFIEHNRASTNRIQEMAGLSDERMKMPVGEFWTVSIVLAHLAFWDRRVLVSLAKTEQEGKLFTPQIDIAVNDILLPLWVAIPPSEAARLAVETAVTLDQRLEALPSELLDEVYNYNQRWVNRFLHRNEHLDEAEAALQQH